MARVANTDIPNNKRVVISLTYIYGIGKSLSKNILSNTNIDENKRVKDLTEDELTRIRDEIRRSTQDDNEFKIEGSLRTDVKINIKRLIDIKTYRGQRHRRGLPVRGQSTRQNARTAKGPKRTVANKKKATK